MLQLKIEAIKWETPDTATFFLSELSGKKIHYKAGQFITFVFTHHTEEIRRSYSLSSSPDEDLLAITVKRITNGEISRFMLSKLKPGEILNAVEPAGRFTVTDSKSNKNIFLFAAGSGISPVFAQLKHALARPGNSRFILIYSSLNQSSILFKEELDKLATDHPGRLKIIHLLSSDGNRLNNTTVEQLVKRNATFDLNKAEFYLCGPFAYMRMIRLTLIFMEIEPAQIRKENFVIETVAVTTGKSTYPPGKIKINYKGELYDISVGENQSILQAALQNNIQLPYSCRAGICSTCTALCKNGTVVMTENDVLTDKDLDEGWILTCTGHPIGDDVVVEFK
ncbi:2Fe-2S iron-sulfur cluster-binding protein [Mucilaginibacter sp. McL0603]|uniref:2Fe-2S iron-sulfur cluster-binding protein n=1 Tax=Mucilaginibacter sp. McL0603 TaxID=3415670 RepID=UPI003CE85C18